MIQENKKIMQESNNQAQEDQYQQIIQSIYELGQASFKSSLKIETIRNYLKKMLGQKQWRIKFNKNLVALLRQMIQSKVQYLSLQSPFKNSIQKPLQQLAHINFEQLKILQINRLKITNIEHLIFFKMPKLQTLNLSFNNVSSLKSLNKIYFSNLKMLAVDHNPVSFMGSMKWSNSNFNELQINKINLFQYSSNHVIDQDMSGLLKLKSKDEMKFWVKASFRIKLAKIKQMLKKKYQNIEIYQ